MKYSLFITLGLSEEVAKTFLAIVKISGKSIKTIYRAISLLKLFSEGPELSATVAEILTELIGIGQNPFEYWSRE